MTDATLRLARRRTVSAATNENTTQAQRDAAYRGEYDDDPHFPEMLAKARYHLSVTNRHGEADEAMLRRAMMGAVG